MSENLPSLLPSTSEFDLIQKMATIAFKSGLLPSGINTPEKAVVIALKGRELNIPMMLAFSQIAIINGKPTMQAELMMSQVYRHCPNAIINQLRSDNEGCVIEAKRPGGKLSQFSFLKEDAERAQLLNKGPWKQYPRSMYRARVISAMARFLFPDAINGISYTPEEMGAEIEIDDNGEEIIKDVTPKKEEPKAIPNHAPVSSKENSMTVSQKKELWTRAQMLGFKVENLQITVGLLYGISELNDLTNTQATELIELLIASKTQEEFGELVQNKVESEK